ncbi:MBL fold metallo-hydrolase [Thalassomonas actiniarum]|uniref:MBL fold metallo-hydrolase n=1 Tax=Thalassomonas actiniarum TaxID=485447 RepID=A0AAE9YPE9_9GAMM|nr:MBL fold metallo-hydrolase [Thalassomonas actiniarum]WDD97106.1 MBL fold metallo-hydrolase [Thalassomonas actiniarum]
MKKLFATLTLLSSVNVWANSSQVAPVPAELVVEHVANAGVKIVSGDKVTLIDALFGPHSRFNFLDEQEFKRLSGQGADLALTTHAHSDHFHPQQTTAFLKENEETLWVTTPQTIKHLGRITDSAHIISPELTGFESQHFSHESIKVSVLSFPHMAPQTQTQNYAYLVEVNGWKVLHVGDADINAEVIAAHQLAQKNIDILLIHDLFPLVKENYQALLEQINARKVAFVHVMDKKVKPLTQWLKDNLPDAALLATGHESVVLKR